MISRVESWEDLESDENQEWTELNLKKRIGFKKEVFFQHCQILKSENGYILFL